MTLDASGTRAQIRPVDRKREVAKRRWEQPWHVPMSILVLICLVPSVHATVYEVGPSQPYAAIGDVPWESLVAGDTVRIHWRANAYHEKWVICRQGTAQAPITVTGVPSPSGNLPVIDGDNATTRSELDFWNEGRGVIKIGGANTPPDTIPSYIAIENLEIRNGRPPSTFTGCYGPSSYTNNCAAIYIEKGEHITLRNCALKNCGNGLFSSFASSDVLVEGCLISENGIEGSGLEHNVYTESAGIVFQYNHLAPLRPNCGGNNLKDRSAGTVIRYNYIEGGNRQLDLVDSDYEDIYDLTSYSTTYVYGNVLVEYDGTDNSQICHYGGDSEYTYQYRKGTLHFYNNTVVSYRTGNTTLLRLSTNAETCDCRNNILYTDAGEGFLAMLDDTGTVGFENNWFTEGWVSSHSGPPSGTLNNLGRNIEGLDPGFVDLAAEDFELVESSPCVGRVCGLNPSLGPEFQVAREYVLHQEGRDRTVQPPQDLGAYEYRDPNAPEDGLGADPSAWQLYR
ncbi:polysaccharide-degrading enzyme [Candidatus Sumerlaeota bacterium]|nr:polysaccharide-degrading enzyme [Candidatus Sumerlaeota bacterium]